MEKIEKITEELKEQGIVIRLINWKDKRVYIHVAGYNQGYAGCRSHQLYWDLKSEQLVNKFGKGMRPDAYDQSVKAVVKTIEKKREAKCQ